MKKILTTLLLCLVPITAHSWDDSECCEQSCSWSVGAEWLYFMPSFDQSEFLWDGATTTLNSVNAIGDRVGEKQRYYSAYRIEGSFLFCNQVNAITVRYTNFYKNYFTKLFTNRGSQILGNPFDPVLEDDDAGSVAYDRKYRYYNIEGLFSLYKTSFCRFSPTVSTGVKFLHLHIKENALYADNSTPPDRQFVQPDMSAWALGPCIEFDGLYCITSCLDLTGRLLWGVLADQNRSKTTIIGGPATNQTNSELLIKNTPKFWHIISSYDVRLGAAFSRQLCGLHIQLEGGYELLQEERLLSRIYNVDSPALGFSFNEWSDFTLNGPYARLNLTY